MIVRSHRGVAELCLVASVALVAPPRLAFAQVRDEAATATPKGAAEDNDAKVRELMRSGVAEYRKKNLEAARNAFAEAWRVAPKPEVAAALADVELKLGRYRDAAEHWEFYLRSDPPDRADAEARLADCRPHVALARVRLEPAGAELEVDGARPSTEPTVGVWLEPGAHTFTARFEGRPPATKRLELAPGEEADVQLTLAPASPVARKSIETPQGTALAAPVPQAVHAPEPPFPSRTIVVAGGVILTVAAAAVGTWSLIRSRNAEDERVHLLNDLYRDYPGTEATHSVCSPRQDVPAKCSDVASKVGEADRAHNLAVGSFVTAGVLGAATVATYLLWPSAEKQSTVALAPFGDLHTHGLQLVTAF